MATRKRNPKNEGKGDGGKSDRGKSDDDGSRDEHHEEAGAVEVHNAYLEHRLGGGAPATPAAYRRAFEQFRRLPGAMRANPTVAPIDDGVDDEDGVQS